MVQLELTDDGMKRLTNLVEFKSRIWSWKSEQIAADRHRVTLYGGAYTSSFDWPPSPDPCP